MGVAIGVAASLLGVIFIIVGFKGGGTDAMNGHLIQMIEGQYPDWGSSNTSVSDTTPITATTGGANKSAPSKPPAKSKPAPGTYV